MLAENKIIYILIEKINREGDSKILVATELARRGVTVLIGYFAAIAKDLEFLPRGIVLIKGMNKVQMLIAKHARRHGHLVVATDEEALGIADGELMIRDVDQQANILVTHVLCQGDMQVDALVSLAGFRMDQLSVTGNARMDILRAPFSAMLQREAEEIRQEYGEFILINTNSGSINHEKWPDINDYLNVLVRIGYMNSTNSEDMELFYEHIEHDKNNMRAVEKFLELSMSQFSDTAPNFRFVLRPHPSEGAEHWRKFAANFPNLRIVTDTEAAPWVMASNFLIQTGCTTGVEAAVLGTACVSLLDQPDHIKLPDCFMSNVINPIARTPEQAVEMVLGHLTRPSEDPNLGQDPRLEKLRPHLEIDPVRYAFEKVADALMELLPSDLAENFPNDFALSSETHHHLRRNTDRTTFREGYISKEDLEDRLVSLQAVRDLRLDIEIRDIEWGVYIINSRSLSGSVDKMDS